MNNYGVQLWDESGNKVYPYPFYNVGDLYLTTNSANPSTILGGTWELFGPGRAIVCVNTNDSDFNAVKKTGGSKTHWHDVRLRLPMDYGDLLGEIFAVGGQYGLWSYQDNKYNREVSNEGNASFLWNAGHTLSNSSPANGVRTSTATSSTSSSGNLQPFITCYIWIRTA